MSEYNIKEVSKMFNLPASILRYYEEMGILTNIPRSDSGQRIYLDMHINRLKTICCFKNTGMTISQLQTFFAYETNGAAHIDDILVLLNNQKESVAEKIKELQNAHAMFSENCIITMISKKAWNRTSRFQTGKIINMLLLNQNSL